MWVRRTLKIVGVVLGVFLVVLLVTAYVFVSNYGDPPERPGITIVNNTPDALTVRSVLFYFPSGSPAPWPGWKPLLVAEVPAHGEAEAAGGPCIGGNQLVARAPDGTVVARRGPFEECNPDAWVIEG